MNNVAAAVDCTVVFLREATADHAVKQFDSQFQI